MKKYTRSTLFGTAGFAAMMLLAGCTGAATGEAGAAEGGIEEIQYGSWQPGAPAVSNMFTHFLQENTEIQEKHGIKFTDKTYTNLQALYTDFAQGRVEGVSGGPSTMAATAAQGAPIRMAGTAARSTASILSAGKTWNAESLRGARLVAPTSTSTWSEVEGQIEDEFGLVPGDYELVASQDLGGAVTQLAAGTADYAMTWGEYIPNALQKFPNVEVAATPEELAGDGKPFWQFSISVHESVSDEGSDALLAAASEVVEWMQANPDEVDAYAVSQGQTPGVAKSMIEGIQTFDFSPVDEGIKTELSSSFDRLIGMGRMKELPPESFYGN